MIRHLKTQQSLRMIQWMPHPFRNSQLTTSISRRYLVSCFLGDKRAETKVMNQDRKKKRKRNHLQKGGGRLLRRLWMIFHIWMKAGLLSTLRSKRYWSSRQCPLDPHQRRNPQQLQIWKNFSRKANLSLRSIYSEWKRDWMERFTKICMTKLWIRWVWRSAGRSGEEEKSWYKNSLNPWRKYRMERRKW